MTKKTHNPSAAVVFSDHAYGEMLTNELLLSNFDITDEKHADLLLTETDFLPFITNKNHTIAFLPQDKATDIPKGDFAVFPYIFSLSALQKELKRIYSEILAAERSESDYKNHEIEKGSISISVLPDGRSALVGGEKIALSSNEWAMLSLLCSAAEKGESVSREALGKKMGHIAGEGGNIVDVYICRLRKKIEFPIGRRLIFTVRGEGYSLIKKEEKL